MKCVPEGEARDCAEWGSEYSKASSSVFCDWRWWHSSARLSSIKGWVAIHRMEVELVVMIGSISAYDLYLWNTGHRNRVQAKVAAIASHSVEWLVLTPWIQNKQIGQSFAKLSCPLLIPRDIDGSHALNVEDLKTSYLAVHDANQQQIDNSATRQIRLSVSSSLLCLILRPSILPY